MIQAVGNRLICSYSRDNARPKDGHKINCGSRDSYLRISLDAGRTWSEEITVADDPIIGEVNEGIGLDETGAAILWVRCWGKDRRHELYRTVDGQTIEKIATVRPDPFPMQIMDPVRVKGLGLVSPWFAGNYSNGGSNSWGLLVSTDNGRTWSQRIIEKDLSIKEWVTEPSLVDLGGGRLLIVGRCEKRLGNQFQVTSTDGGKTWKKARTNISDVKESTPSLVYDAKSGIVANYYYHRGAKQLKRRVAMADFIFDHPDCWPEPEVLDEGFEQRSYDAGNVKATRLGDRDCCAWYTGTQSNATVVVTVAASPVKAQTGAWPGFEHGMGIGGWLTNYKRFNVLPEERRLQLTQGDFEHFDSYITEEDVKRIKEWGFDHLRLGFDQIVLEESPGKYRERVFRKIDEFIGWCGKHKINVVLNLHKAIGNYCDIKENVELLDDDGLQRRFIDLWLEIERRYHDFSGLAFEILNEVRDLDPGKWNDLADRTVKAIRERNPDRWVVIGSTCWNSPGKLKDLKVWDDPKVVYTFHMYAPFEFTHQRGVLQHEPLYCNMVLEYPSADVERYRTCRRLGWYAENPYPNAKAIDKAFLAENLRGAFEFAKAHPDKILWNGEFGTIRHAPPASRVAYMRDVVSLCREHGIPYCVWNYLSTPNDGNRFSLVDDDTREFLSQELLYACLGASRMSATGDYRLPEDVVVSEAPGRHSPAIVGLQELQRMIDGASAHGGGRVVVPAGRHVVGQIDLKSNVELHLEKGAVLEGKVGLENYRVTALPYSEGTWSAVVSAIGVTNVAITGEGEIFGNGTAWPQPEGYGGNQEGRRPRGVFFADCRDVLLSDFTLRDSACWGVVFKCCENVDVRRLRIDNHANANNDGIDIEARNAVIADCDIDAGDDAVCLKSNNPDFVVENVLVSNVTARSHCNALKLGTASHGTMRNVLFVDCRTDAPRRDFTDFRFGRKRPWYVNGERPRAYPGVGADEPSGHSSIAVENVDGGVVENVTFRRIAAYGACAPIFIRAGTRTGRSCGTPPSDKRIFRNILLEDIEGASLSHVASSITGVEGCRVKGVALRNVRIVCRGGGDTAAEMLRPVPEVPGKYPDAHMFGSVLPAFLSHQER